MQRPEWLRPPRGVRWTPAMGVAGAAAVVVGGVAIWGLLGLGGSLLSLPFPTPADPSESFAVALERAKTFAELQRKRFDGRSAFFMPSPPARKAPKPVKPPEPPKPVEPPKPPPPPSEYAGPRPLGALGDVVFFADNNRIRIGEERMGVRVLSTSPPWSVRLAHSGGEYDVALWPKGNEPFFNSDWASQRSVPGIETVPQHTSADPGRPARPGSAPGVAPPAAPPGTPPGPVQPALPPGAQPPSEPPPGPQAQSAPASGDLVGGASPALTAEQVSTMTRAEVQAAIAAVSRSRMSRNLDDATRQRLNSEQQMLSNRLTALQGQSAPR
jgi:hypothetical protein